MTTSKILCAQMLRMHTFLSHPVSIIPTSKGA